MKFNLITFLALILLPVTAMANVLAANYTILYAGGSSTLQDVYDGFCDDGNIVTFPVTGNRYFISGCYTTPTAQKFWPIDTSMITDFSTVMAGKLDVPAGTTSQYLRGDGSLATFPTTLGSFTNSPGYITAVTAALTYYHIPTGTTSQYIRGDGTFATFPTIPTQTGDLTNNSGFITSSALSPYLTASNAASIYATASDVTGKFNTPSGTTAQYVRGDGSLATSPTNLSAFTNGPGYTTASAVASAYYPIPTGTTSQYVRGDGTLATLPTAGSRTFSTPTRALNSCFQIDNMKDADFHYAVDVTTGLSLTSGATGTVTATSYTNSGCTTGAVIESEKAAGQSGSLVVGLNISQAISVGIDGTLQGGKWMKITTANTSGSPTFSIRSNGQREIIQP